MTANASPAVLAPVDVLRVIQREVERAGGGSYQDGRDLIHAYHAVEQMAADLAASEAQMKEVRSGNVALLSECGRLGADLAAAREEVAKAWHDYAGACVELDTLRQRAEGAEADAARYRWLRTLNVPQFTDLFARNIRGENFDAMVDQEAGHG